MSIEAMAGDIGWTAHTHTQQQNIHPVLLSASVHTMSQGHALNVVFARCFLRESLQQRNVIKNTAKKSNKKQKN